ncbi:hypothetical protein QTJ16_004104 [Diplocarpon rosae]|uniref:Cyclin-like domain-containing protein n=1 Tax=Diplocarpon rosae TaxID=946125 RepID=A0AAD9WFD7_9HELO|nr:hypothetical protein QTJ16_004104 [Diplocarpon rosae]
MAPPKKIVTQKPNPLRNRVPIKEQPPTLVRQATAGAAARAKAATLPPPKKPCPNKECVAPDIQDGICHGCGFIVDDSNIVSEIQFGESSSGAAVVQGSFVAADQGGARTMGPGFQRSGGENRESTIRDGLIQNMGAQLGIRETTVSSGVQIFKLAAMNNFIQGRRMDMVCAVCLYSACRKESPCRIMLIDFADKVQANVFKLGHTFKKLHETIAIAKAGIQPVLPEDLIFRFAQKLEFGNLMTKVAEDAVRMVQRMSLDWMVMGRRPSGVCGACLILAARMNNFRRTITEVVYIVKVTTHTIQKRLEEFKQTPSSALTVEEFLHNEFLESAHDPPSYYEKTEEFQKKKKRRRRRGHDGEDGEGSGSDNGDTESATPNPNKRQKTTNPGATNTSAVSVGTSNNLELMPTAQTSSETPGSSKETPNIDTLTGSQASTGVGTSASSWATSSSQATTIPEKAVELRRDADGFIIPPQPVQSYDIPIDPSLIDSQIADQTETSLELLNQTYNEDQTDEIDDAAVVPVTAGGTIQPGLRKGAKPIFIPEAWSAIEREMEDQINEMISDPRTEEQIDEMISDPNTPLHRASYAEAAERAAGHMRAAEASRTSKEISMDEEIGEDEFADDPEVQNCLLSEADAARKEKVWANENKAWLRNQQIKEWNKKNAQKGPPKAKRNRKPKPRIGEGQTSAASSPGEAAIAALKQRAFSKKINYDAINSMFASLDRLKDKDALGSAATSRIASRAGSEASDNGSNASLAAASAAQGSDTGSTRDTEEDIPLFGTFPPPQRKRYPTKRQKEKAKAAEAAEAAEEDEEDGDDDDYIKPTEEAEAVDDWKSSLKKNQTADGEEEEEYVDNEDYDDMGGIEAGGFADDDDAVFGDSIVYGDDDDAWGGGDDYDE